MTTEQEAVRDIGIQLLLSRQQLGDQVQRCSDPACNGWRLNPVVTQHLKLLLQSMAGPCPWEISSAMSDDLRFVVLTLASQVPVEAYRAVLGRILDDIGGSPVETEDGIPILTAQNTPPGPLLAKMFEVLGFKAPPA
jgi:hypothetical protein